jgi:hypothetical protein
LLQFDLLNTFHRLIRVEKVLVLSGGRKGLFWSLHQRGQVTSFLAIFAHRSHTDQSELLNIFLKLLLCLFVFHFAFLTSESEEVINLISVETKTKSWLHGSLLGGLMSSDGWSHWLIFNIVCGPSSTS